MVSTIDPTRVTPTMPANYDVLIVEDEPVSRRAMLVLATAHGFDARAVRSAEEGLTLVEVEGIPPVVLVDLHLPGMDGLEFIQRLTSSSATLIPVLITAAAADAIPSERQPRQTRLVRKPLEFGRLVELIRDTVRSN